MKVPLLSVKILSVVGAMVMLSIPAQAAVIFDQTQTGAQLFSNASVSFPNSPANTTDPVVNGTSLDFMNTTNDQNPVLMRWSLLPASPHTDLTFTIFLDYTAITTDNDPIFAIQAGSNFVGVLRADNNNGSVFSVSGPINNTVIPGGQLANTDQTLMLSGIGPVDQMIWQHFVADGGAGPQTLFNFSEGADVLAGPLSVANGPLNVDEALSFVLVGNWFNDGTEQYRINSLRVIIEEADPNAVPEPAILSLLGIGFVVCAGSRIRRRKVKG